eukprot:4560023-Ditylum_brightwellii.AAC.1
MATLKLCLKTCSCMEDSSGPPRSFSWSSWLHVWSSNKDMEDEGEHLAAFFMLRFAAEIILVVQRSNFAYTCTWRHFCIFLMDFFNLD